jgi:hypothetical protein
VCKLVIGVSQAGSDFFRLNEKYFVLHKWDPQSNSLRENKHKRPLYDIIAKFTDYVEAADFALEKMNERPILAKGAVNLGQGEEAKNPALPYVIALHFPRKYESCSYDGSCDPVPTNEIERCKREELEDTLIRLAEEEQPEQIYWGIELKLLPILENKPENDIAIPKPARKAFKIWP